ncbi:unnamed protein product [Coregonus sp. 'balchen']|nr:unnamed protein product [Coregonus sp. 'balchen']
MRHVISHNKHGGCLCFHDSSDSFTDMFCITGRVLLDQFKCTMDTGLRYCYSRVGVPVTAAVTEKRCVDGAACMCAGTGGYRTQPSHAVPCPFAQQTRLQRDVCWIPW